MNARPVVRGPVATLALALAGLLAACGSAEPAPATGGAPSEAPVSGPGDPTPVIAETSGPGIVITAQAIEFGPQAVTVPAGAPFTLVLDNRDDGMPHNIAVKGMDGTMIAKGEIVTGPARTELVVAPLLAGSYAFTCEVHPNMTGTITVTP
jgi:plastocyanin